MNLNQRHKVWKSEEARAEGEHSTLAAQERVFVGRMRPPDADQPNESQSIVALQKRIASLEQQLLVAMQREVRPCPPTTKLIVAQASTFPPLDQLERMVELLNKVVPSTLSHVRASGIMRVVQPLCPVRLVVFCDALIVDDRRNRDTLLLLRDSSALNCLAELASGYMPAPLQKSYPEGIHLDLDMQFALATYDEAVVPLFALQCSPPAAAIRKVFVSGQLVRRAMAVLGFTSPLRTESFSFEVPESSLNRASYLFLLFRAVLRRCGISERFTRKLCTELDQFVRLLAATTELGPLQWLPCLEKEADRIDSYRGVLHCCWNDPRNECVVE